MLKWMLAAGAAALAITAPVTAQGGGGGKDKAAQAERGGKGQARAQRSGGERAARAPQRAERPQRSSQRVERAERSPQRAERGQRSAQRVERPQRSPQRLERADRAPQRSERVRSAQRVDRGQDRVRAAQVARRPDRATAERIDSVDRANNLRVDRRADREVIRNEGRRFAVVDRSDSIVRIRDVNRGVVRVRDVDRDDLFVRRLGYGGCPPGLAKKAVACLPPGQAAKLVGQPFASATRIAAFDPFPRSMNNLFWDNDDYYYRYGGGYAYRVDRNDNLIAAMIPLFGAALIGRPLQPSYLNPYYQPSYFNAFYPNSQYDCYRNGYGYVYETNCMTGMVEDVIPTYGYGYGVGQLMPASYGYYNLPYTYRSSFIDNDDYYYRYAPGAIYQVDRGSSLISAVVALLAGGLTVGQQMPIGYNAYNVPMAYRSTYYDRPDVWYRYNDGYIYAVDPGTRMVNSVAYAIV
jgi:hypothetical protein